MPTPHQARPLLLVCALAACGDSGSVADPTSSSDTSTTTTDPPTPTTTDDPPTTSDPGTTDDPGTTGDSPEPAEPPSGNQVDQNKLFTCVDEPAMPPADLRLLDRQEWTRSVGVTANSTLSLNPLFPRPDHRYSTYGDDEALDPSVLSLYLDVVGRAGSSWNVKKYNAGNLRTVIEDPETQCFLNDAQPTAECTRYFVRRYLERGALYRPASDEQVDALYEFAVATLAGEADADARPATVNRVASAAWMTTGALHRPELGAGAPDPYGRLRLGDWELAQAIAHALTRAPAGAPSIFVKNSVGYSNGDVDGDLGDLLAAAADGSIHDPEVIAALVRAHVGGLDPERRDLVLDGGNESQWANRSEYGVADGVRDFFREWLGHGKLASKTPKVEVSATSAWTGGIVEGSYHNTVSGNRGDEGTLVTQLDDMIARIIVGDSDVFATLLTSRMFYTPAIAPYQEGVSNIWKTTAEMNRVYNVTGITEPTREARWIELPANERAGVLTHPAWLGTHALSFENDANLVHRGKWIREELLCQDLPDLPLNVDAMLSDATKSQSARQRISEKIDADPYCNGCHQYMNPLGYPFEIYNHAGFVRVDDHGSKPDGSSTLVNMPSPELDGPVTDAVALSQRLAASPYAKRCFLRQTFRYFAGRDETLSDACTMVAMEKAYDDSDGSFTELLIALFTSDSFQTRLPD